MSDEMPPTMERRGLAEHDLLELAKYALKTGDESVTEQYQEVQSIRLRASFLITVNALSATFFAQISRNDLQPDLFLALAVLSFVACNIYCVLVMMPSGNWRITKSAGKILAQFEEGGPDLTGGRMLSVLAIKTDEDQVANEVIVRTVHSQFLFAAVLFVFGTISWIFYSQALAALFEGG